MEKGNLIIQKAIAVFIIFTMIMSQYAIIGASAISYAIDMLATNNDNVEFIAYFKTAEGEEVTSIEKEITSKDLKLYVDVAVKNEGYFDGQISLVNAGFKIREDSTNEYINKIENNVIYLNRINSEEIAKLEVGIEYAEAEEIIASTLSGTTGVKLTGNYRSSQNSTEIDWSSEVTVKWKTPEGVTANLAGKIMTNNLYLVEGANKKIVQAIVSSKITDNNYPAKTTQIELTVPEGAENVEVHKRTTKATNGNKNFNSTPLSEQNKVTITVENTETNGIISWNKNAQDIFVVTCQFPENIDLSSKKIDINSIITTYDDKQLVGTPVELSLNETKEEFVTCDTKEQESEIYKGKIYTGEEREYSTATKVNIDYVKAITTNGLTIEETQPKFVSEKEEKNVNAEYKKIVFNKANIEQILGTTWKLNVLDQDNTKKTISNETEADESGNIVVPLNAGVTSFKINTECEGPYTKGELIYTTTKVIKNQELTREEVKKLTSIKDTVKVTYIKTDSETGTKQNDGIITLKEPESKVNFEVSPITLTTSSSGQEIQMTAVLETNKENRDLFKNPVIKIKMPSQIESITNASCQLLYGNNELAIDYDNRKIEKENGQFVITIPLVGEQTKYSAEAEVGPTISITATVKLNSEAENSTEQIVLNYTNENETIYADGQEEKVTVEVAHITENTNNNRGENNQNTSNENTNTNQEQEEVVLSYAAKVGADVLNDGDSVKAGEVIKYRVQIKNNTDQDIEGASLNISIPEGTKLIEINPEYDITSAVTINQRGDYWIEKEDREIKRENIRIKAGEPFSYIYNIRATNTEDTNIESKAILQYGDNKTETKTISSQLKKSNLKVTMNPKYTGVDKIKAGEWDTYYINIQNISNEVQRNIKININEDDSFIIKEWADGENEYETNNSMYTIDELGVGQTKELILNVEMIKTNDSIAKISAIIIDNENNRYRTEGFQKTIYTSEVDIKLAQAVNSTNEKGYVTPGDKITYTIDVENKGEADLVSLDLRDLISIYVNVDSIQMDGQNLEYDYNTIEGISECKEYSIDIPELKIGEKKKITINTTVSTEWKRSYLLDIINKASIHVDGFNAETEELKYQFQSTDEIIEEDNNVQGNNEQGNNEQGNSEQGNSGENNNGNGSEDDSNANSNEKNNNSSNTSNGYKISGIVWLDKNKNGQRESAENLLSGITVYAINATTNKMENTITTDENGEYVFSNLNSGIYIIMFEYDSTKYMLTTYQVAGVASDKNSDGVKRTATINEEKKTVASTDKIELTKDIANIDLGLIESKVFDLALEKVVTKIVVTSKSGTKNYEFDDEDIAKVEIAGKELSESNVVIEYKIKVTNVGEVAGYASSIIDSKPKSLAFNSRLNKDWYTKDNKLYNDSLSDTKIEPGETKELTLILTKTMTESNTGLVNNKANISKSYTEQGISDESDSNNTGTADAIITVKTGKTVIYLTFVIMAILIIVSLGIIYFANKKIMKKLDI